MRARVWIAAAALAGSLAATASTGSAKPSLTIADEQPLAVSGTAFHSRELVRVQAVGRFGTRTRSVRATRQGRFLIRFTGLTGDPCKLRFVKATGAGGSRAMLRLPPGVCPELGPD
jgi:hypothetical protein